MKFERINDNQIKCTLTNSDLASRQIKISELAYGSSKARELFKDLMTQASVELDFDAANMPIMVEAIPVPGDSLVLIITRVEDPEELDTRFSAFSSIAEALQEAEYEPEDTSSNEILEIFRKYSRRLAEQASAETVDGEAADAAIEDRSDNIVLPFPEADNEIDETGSDPSDLARERLRNSLINLNEMFAGSILPDLLNSIDIPVPDEVTDDVSHADQASRICAYKFQTLDSVCELSIHTGEGFACRNTLYKDTVDMSYVLVIFEEEGTADEFDAANILCAEYGSIRRLTNASVKYYEEHYDVIIKDRALQILNNL